MDDFIDELKRKLHCEVRADQVSRRLYSSDASIYDVEPLAVVIARTKYDLTRLVSICSKHAIPITCRGAATGIAGGCLGKGVIIDTSTHLNRVLEVNYEEGFARVEPGVVADRLNEIVRPYGLYFAPEISTSNRATIGGMVSTNAAGANSLEVGEVRDHVLEIELILATGQVVSLSDGHVDRTLIKELERIREKFSEDIKEKFPKYKRRASGYNLDSLADQNYAALVCGSEGTLGIISEIKVLLSPLPSKKELVVVGYNNLQDALISSSQWLAYVKPSVVEMIDKKILDAGRKSPKLHSRLSWLEGNPEALVMWEVERADALLDMAAVHPSVLFAKKIADPGVREEVWEVRKSGLGLLLSKRSFSRAIAFIEDVAVPPGEVASFTKKLQNLLSEYGKEAGIYGHIGAGCLHVRPYIDLREQNELEAMQHIAEKVGGLLLESGGVYSGEHGDGLARTWTNQRMFGERLYAAFFELKNAFDPQGIMNPGKIVASKPQGLLENLKLTPETKVKEFSTYLDFSREGGYALAADLCNGNGACRKKESLMCPSFQATLDEKDSTRARANALRGLIHGKLPEDTDLHSVMDLCLQCKGCKKECPSQVDMAKMKSEWLYHNKKSIMSYLFGHATLLFKWGAYFSWLTPLAERFLQRKVPHFAKARFSSLYKPQNKAGAEVVLFIDSYTEFLTPQIGLAAVKLLERLGYTVICPPWECCGRPLISKGFLPEAKSQLEKIQKMLRPYAERGVPILCLEPSCLSVLVDDIRDFKMDGFGMQPFASFLLQHKAKLKELLTTCEQEVLVHGHCHQKALFGMQDEIALLKETCAPNVQEIPSGCCGMAGSFGYENIDISKKIAELVLFPAIRAKKGNAIVIASGNSCRSQIEDGFDFIPLHFAEFLANQLHAKSESL